LETVDVLFVIDYERLDVYRLSLDFIASTSKLREGLPRGNGELSDQFKRASFSLVLNIAEGAGKQINSAIIRSLAAPRWNVRQL
jgi:four helix bundle protein